MGAAITSTARGAANILANRITIDMSNEISLLKPRLSPLTVISKRLNTKGTNNYKFEWMEDSLMARWVSASGAKISSDTDVVLQSGEGALVAVGDLLKVVTTGEVVRVTAVSTDTLTIARAYGETAAGAIALNGKLLVVGNANMQGGVAPAEKYNSPTAAYNYTQIFKTPFSVTNTLEAMKLYGPSELARLHAKKGAEHAMSIEYAMLFGERKLDTTGAQPVTATGGVLKFLAGTSNIKSISKSTGTQKDLDAFMESIFTYGADSKTMFCSPSVVTWFNQLAQGKVQIIQSDTTKTFGLDISSYVTPHGKLNMVMHPLLVQGYADYGFVLDLDNISYRPLSGRDTKLMTNIQNNDEDGRRDMYQTECGLELRLPSTHGILTLTA